MKIKITLFLLLAAALVGGCKNSTTVEDEDLGTLRGNVTLINVDGKPISAQAGTRVTIDGTNFSAITDSTGAFQIDNVPAGIYNIIETKPGFDSSIIPQLQFSGAGTTFLMYDSLERIPLDSIPFSVIDSNSIYLVIHGLAAGSDPLQQAWLTFGRDSTRSAMESGLKFRQGYIRPIASDRTFTFSAAPIDNIVNAQSGDTVYFRISAIGVNYTKYYSPLTTIYSSNNGSTVSPYSVVRQFILP